jgi:hypothetical protein
MRAIRSAGLAGALGLAYALPWRGVWRPDARVITRIASASPAAAIWAGVFPLPDPRHDDNPFDVTLFAAPLAVALALWRAAPWSLRLCLAVNACAFALCVAPGESGLLTPTGWFQRVFAAIAFVPEAAAALWAMRRGEAGSASGNRSRVCLTN